MSCYTSGLSQLRWWEGATVTYWVETKDAAEHPLQHTGQPHSKKVSGPRVSGAEVGGALHLYGYLMIDLIHCVL